MVDNKYLDNKVFKGFLYITREIIMNNKSIMTLGQRNLFQQGFQSYTRSELNRLNVGLRFTPFVCMLLGFIGLMTHNLYLLTSVSIIGVVAAFFPDKHPFDLFYNHFIRRLYHAKKLPANPLQRRLACLGAGFMNGSIAILFLFDPTIHQIALSEISFSIHEFGVKGQFAYYLGFSLLFMQLIVFSNHFCLLSWAYEKLMAMIGEAHDKPISAAHVARLRKLGVKVIDVRNEDEFAQNHIKGSQNIPLEKLKNPQVIAQLSEKIVLLYCHTGRFSHIAQELLRKKGISLSYNLGSMKRANTMLP
jgi:rhodanese-related sulfurtransferase